VPRAPERIANADDAPPVGDTGSLVASAPAAPQPVAPAGDGAISATTTALAPQAEPQTNNGGFFGRLFGANPRPTADVPNAGQSLTRQKQAAARQRLRERANSQQVEVARASTSSSSNKSALPGVKKNRGIFGNIFGDQDDIANENAADVKVASVGGFARISRNGLLRQHEGVRVNCFKPELLSILRKVEKRYGKKVIVTSGYRSPKGNRRAGGARNSRHTYCDAADIQVSGVSKWDLAKYLRTVSGRGGVGTYCHTKSVHIDTYKKRDWNWACRRKSRRRG
jgi:uncharacterized protein YcbK (DUF882 family)